MDYSQDDLILATNGAFAVGTAALNACLQLAVCLAREGLLRKDDVEKLEHHLSTPFEAQREGVPQVSAEHRAQFEAAVLPVLAMLKSISADRGQESPPRS